MLWIYPFQIVLCIATFEIKIQLYYFSTVLDLVVFRSHVNEVDKFIQNQLLYAFQSILSKSLAKDFFHCKIELIFCTTYFNGDLYSSPKNLECLL